MASRTHSLTELFSARQMGGCPVLRMGEGLVTPRASHAGAAPIALRTVTALTRRRVFEIRNRVLRRLAPPIGVREREVAIVTCNVHISALQCRTMTSATRCGRTTAFHGFQAVIAGLGPLIGVRVDSVARGALGRPQALHPVADGTALDDQVVDEKVRTVLGARSPAFDVRERQMALLAGRRDRAALDVALSTVRGPVLQDLGAVHCTLAELLDWIMGEERIIDLGGVNLERQLAPGQQAQEHHSET